MTYTYSQLLALVAPVYGVMLVGFAIRRLRWLTAEADASLLRVSVNLLSPCLILDSILGNPALRRTENLLWPPLVGTVTVMLGFALAWLAAPRIGLGDPVRRRTFSFTVGLYNYGFIALPIVIGLFDERTVGVLFTHNLGVEVCLWTAGVVLLSGSAAGSGWRRALNGPVIAVLIAVPLNLAHGREWLPSVVLTSIHMIAQTAIPIALILIGATIADWVTGMRLRRESFIVPVGAPVLRLAVLPILFLVMARYLPFSMELKRVMVVQAAMPCAVIPVVLARHYGGDSDVALQAVLATSVLGLLTIPWWIQFGLHFAGVS